MVLALPQDVRARLTAIEEAEGVPALEVAHQAVAVWSIMTADERRVLGGVALQLIAARLRS